MKKHFGSLIALCLFAGLGFAAPSTVSAQDQRIGVTQPPKVLVIMREFLKPGKQGAMHEKSEQAFVQAMKQANSPEHYFALNSMSGKPRALFPLGYDSFGAWEKDNQAMMSNPTLAGQFDSAQQADGDLLSGFDTGVFRFQPDMSVSPGFNIGQMRFWQITMVKVRVGHDADWHALAKLHNQVFGNMPNAHWDMFKKAYGDDSGSVYIVFRAMHSLSELDQLHADSQKAYAAASTDQKKQMSDMAASTLKSIETNLFAVSPKMSYPADSWKAADPGFWGGQQ